MRMKRKCASAGRPQNVMAAASNAKSGRGYMKSLVEQAGRFRTDGSDNNAESKIANLKSSLPVRRPSVGRQRRVPRPELSKHGVDVDQRAVHHLFAGTDLDRGDRGVGPVAPFRGGFDRREIHA